MVNYSKITKLRSDKGLSQSFISLKVGMSRGYLKDCIRLNADIPDDKLSLIAELLGTTPAYLRDEIDNPEASTAPDVLDLSKLDPAVADLIKKIVASPLDKVKAINKLLDIEKERN